MAQISTINKKYAIYTINFIFPLNNKDFIENMFWKSRKPDKRPKFGKKKKVFHANPKLLSKNWYSLHILDFTECKLQALRKHSFKLCLSVSQNIEHIFLCGKEPCYFFYFTFWSIYLFLKTKLSWKNYRQCLRNELLKRLVRLMKMTKMRKLTRWGEKQGIFCYMYVPFRNYQIFVIRVGYSCYNQQR